MQLPDGTLLARDRGTPQGSAVSPVLANLFMHYAFDAWMTREYPNIRFERYADDVVVHCVTERQARNLVATIGDRMEQVGLRLHPDKTKIVYCKDQKRRLDDDGLTAFTFWGFTLRTRTARSKCGARFASFQPAISNDARNKISEQLRRWRLHRWTGLSLAEIARQINPVVRGLMQYYGAFYRSQLYPLLSRINAYLMRWTARNTSGYAPLRGPRVAGNASPASTLGSSPTGHGCTVPGGQDDKSPVTRDCHAGICGSRRVRPPPATQQPPMRAARLLSDVTRAVPAARSNGKRWPVSARHVSVLSPH